ncbi:hypothetical protein RJK40_004587 [Salmonella enterica]|nr:hypothetical protein [Salmonella enterica]
MKEFWHIKLIFLCPPIFINLAIEFYSKYTKCSDYVPIELRPAVIDEHNRLEDGRAGFVLGKQDAGAIVTLVERKSRIYLTKKVLSKNSAKMDDAII